MSRKKFCLVLVSSIVFSRESSSAQPDVFVFLRGDANLDTRLDVSDPVHILTALFIDASPILCLDSADADDDGDVTITDAIRILGYLFVGIVSPAGPFPEAGIDPTSDELECVAASSGGFEPPRPVTIEDVEAALAVEDISGARASGASLVVSAEVFDALASLGPGGSILGLAEMPGMPEFMDALLARTPPAGSPVALPFHMTAPYPAGGCYTIDAEAIRGLSRDLGPDATPDGDLLFAVDPQVVCGSGAHDVRFTVTDAAGLSSFANAIVTVCEPGQACEESATNPLPGGLPSGPKEEITCVWIESRQIFPREPVRSERANHYNTGGHLARVDTERPFIMGSDPMDAFFKTAGVGPSHTLLTLRASPLCNTPPTDLAIVGWGQLIVRINLLCFTATDCAVVERPYCFDRVNLEGGYEGSVGVRTDSGETCRGGGNPVEALAQEEASLQINERSVFSKALAVQNGASIRKHVSYEVSGNIGVTGLGLAADIKTTHGITHEVWARTGARRGTLRSFGVHETKTPVTAELTAEGKAELTAEARANGMASAHTNAAALYAVGTTNCPGAGSIVIVEAFGRGEALARTLARIEDFIYQHTGKRAEIRPN